MVITKKNRGGGTLSIKLRYHADYISPKKYFYFFSTRKRNENQEKILCMKDECSHGVYFSRICFLHFPGFIHVTRNHFIIRWLNIQYNTKILISYFFFFFRV